MKLRKKKMLQSRNHKSKLEIYWILRQQNKGNKKTYIEF